MTWWAVLALPVALLIGFAFAAVGMAATTWIRGMPTSTTSPRRCPDVPVLGDVLPARRPTPASAAWLVELSPLYHGVALERGLMLGQVGWDLLVHLAVLVALGAVGLRLLSRRLVRAAAAMTRVVGWPAERWPGEVERVLGADARRVRRAGTPRRWRASTSCPQLGERTADQALAAGVDAREVWLALCADLQVPRERWFGRDDPRKAAARRRHD